jgi:hypothetical protein
MTKLVQKHVSLLAVSIGLATASSVTVAQDRPEDVTKMESLKSLYSLDEEAVVQRLIAEEAAFKQRDLAVAILGDSFAGAWFDASTASLKIAATVGEPAANMEKLGFEVKTVEYSLADLEKIRAEIMNSNSGGSDPRGGFVSASIDQQTRLSSEFFPETKTLHQILLQHSRSTEKQFG